MVCRGGGQGGGCISQLRFARFKTEALYQLIEAKPFEPFFESESREE